MLLRISSHEITSSNLRYCARKISVNPKLGQKLGKLLDFIIRRKKAGAIPR